MITIEVAERDFYALPAPVQEMLRVYGGGFCAVDAGRRMIFRVSETRWPEIAAAMAAHSFSEPRPPP